MGCSAYSSIIVGFEVDHSDFWTEGTTTDSHLSCPDGHTKGAKKGKHCSECGGKFDYQTDDTLTITDNFKKYIGDDDPEGKAGEAWNSDSEAHYEEQAGNAFDGLEYMCADHYTDSETNSETYVLGLKVIDSGSILEGGSYGASQTNTLNEDEIKDLFEKCRKVANGLGIDRPVQLFLVAHCSF